VPAPGLTTTSYAILSLLALRDYSAYELVQRMERSLDFYWPRARSKLYEEPKKLVAAGYARSREARNGRRARAVYRITRSGRRALREWLATPGRAVALESEALLKVAFADQGTLEGLRANLEAIRADAAATREFGRGLAEEFLGGAPTFSERMHIGVFVWGFLHDWAVQRQVWADAALAWIEDWDDVEATPERVAAARVWFEERLSRAYPDADRPPSAAPGERLGTTTGPVIHR
jgi:DNA-binding PadR family transcriptional regulator